MNELVAIEQEGYKNEHWHATAPLSDVILNGLRHEYARTFAWYRVEKELETPEGQKEVWDAINKLTDNGVQLMPSVHGLRRQFVSGQIDIGQACTALIQTGWRGTDPKPKERKGMICTPYEAMTLIHELQFDRRKVSKDDVPQRLVNKIAMFFDAQDRTAREILYASLSDKQ